MSMLWVPMAGTGAMQLSLNGETLSGASTVGVELELRPEGTVFEIVGASETQLSPATDWRRPLVNSSPEVSVRFTQQSGDSFTVGTLDTWLTMDAARAVGYAGGINSGIVLVELSLNGGTTVSESDEYPLQILT